jgi:hypothetical protein
MTESDESDLPLKLNDIINDYDFIELKVLLSFLSFR